MVAKVEATATEKDQPTTEDGLIFEWAPGVPIDDILMDINIHQLDEEMKYEAETQQNILTTNDEPGDLEEYTSDNLLSYDDEDSRQRRIRQKRSKTRVMITLKTSTFDFRE